MFPVIEVRNIYKRYKIYSKPYDKLKEIIFRRNYAFIKEVLKNISFEVFKGEAFGVIGENGAGKSTLLSIIAGMNRPSEGKVIVKGKVAAILELGAGFHPEFTGIENIYLYGNLMGLSTDEIKEKLDFIKSFSELGNYLDKPIKTYSTGMVMRLAFSVMLAIEPDIFIIDEALSVGDLYFQKKAFNKIREFKEKGGTILFTSHSMYQITNLCERALWLKNGKVEMCGNALEVTKEYENYIREKESGEKNISSNDINLKQEKSHSPAWIENVKVNKEVINPGEKLEVEIELGASESIKAHVGLLFRRNDNEHIALYSTKHENITLEFAKKEKIKFVFEDFPLLYGSYFIDIYLTDDSGNIFYDIKSIKLNVRKTSFLDIGICKIKGHIYIEDLVR